MALLGTYFTIRHKATGEFMPQAKRNRGYSNWNPAVADNEFSAALGFPRILQSHAQAQRCINAWNAMPNGHIKPSYDGDDDIEIRDDKRSKDDLEVVEIVIVESLRTI